MIDLHIKMDGFAKLRRAADPKIFDRAANRTLNEVVKAGQREGVQAVYDQFNMTKKDIRAKAKIRRSRIQTLTAELYVPGSKRGLGLMRFNPTWRRGRSVVRRKKGEIARSVNKRASSNQGVSVRIMRGNKAVRLPHAFIARGRSGSDLSTTNAQVWVRGRNGALIPKRIPRPETLFFRKRNVERVVRAANSKWNQRLPHHLRREYRKLR